MKKSLTPLAGVAVFGLLTLVSTGLAQTQSGSEAHRSAGHSAQTANRMTADNNFAEKAATGGLAEVKLAELAKDHASSADVKQFAQRMYDDHSKANDELKSVASKKGITLPTSLDAKHQATYDRLAKLNGADFDRAYMRDMVSDHHEDVNEFKRESEHGTDPELKAFAAKTLPTLQEHLQMAESTNAKVKK